MHRHVLFLLAVLTTGGADAAEDAGALLASAKTAAGGPAWDEVAAIHWTGELQTAGLAGRIEQTEDLRSGRFRADIVLGPLERSEGFDGEIVWYRDGSGEVTREQGAALVAAANNRAWLVARAYWSGRGDGAAISYLREANEGGRRYHLLAATPPAGHPLQLWLNAETLAIERIVEDRGRFVETSEFADFRSVGGLRLPFHQVSVEREGETLIQRSEIRWRDVRPARTLEQPVGTVPSGSAQDYRLPRGEESVTLPFELANNHLYVDVRVDDRALRFLVDTGGFNILTREAVAALGLEAVGSIPAGGTGEERTEVGVVRVGRLALGELELVDQLFYVIDLTSIHGAEGVRFDGLVGFEVFKRFVVRIDYARHRLTLIRPERFEYRGSGQRVPIRLNEGTPEIEGTIDGLAGTFSIDTGSRSVLDVHTPFAAAHDFAGRYCPCVEGLTGWGLGGPVRSKVARAARVELGAVAVDDVLLEISQQQAGSYTDPHIAANVGGGLLKRFDVVFDYGRGEMILERNANFARPEGYDRAGMWLNHADAAFVVIDVIGDGPAAAAGLRAADRILAIDGRAAGELRLADVRERFRTRPPGTRVGLRAERDGRSFDVELILADLVPFRAH